MAQQILTNAKIYAAEFDVSNVCNSISAPKTPDKHETTTFGSNSRTFLPGLQAGGFQLQGFTEFGTGKIEKIMRTLKGQIDKPLTIIPQGSGVGNVALFQSASFAGYEFGALHGNPNQFTWQGGTSKWQVIGGFAEEVGAAPRVATGNSAGKQLGAISASQFLYAAVHVLSGTGTMDLLVESDNIAGFTTPTTVLSFPQFTGIGSAVARSVGPVVDDFYRFKWTLGTTPSFTFIALFGIAS